MPTYTPKASEIERAWHVVDAEGLVLGRMATEVARILRGKHKTIFAPHLDTGDHVVIVNADKVVLSVGQGRPEAGVPPQRLPGWHPLELVRRTARRQAGRRRQALGARHAPQGSARPPDAHQAEGLRRPNASAQRPVAGAARPVRRPRSLIPETLAMATTTTQTTGRRKEAIARSRLRPGTGVLTVNGRPFESYFTTPAHRMIASEPLRVLDAAEKLRRRHDDHRWRCQRPGRGDAHGARPQPRRRRPGVPYHAQEGRRAHARPAQEGEQEVRSRQGAARRSSSRSADSLAVGPEHSAENDAR